MASTTTRTAQEGSSSTFTTTTTTSSLSASHPSPNSSASNSLSTPSPTNSTSSYTDTRIVRFDNECVLIPELQRAHKNGLFKKPLMVTKSYSYTLPPLWKRRSNGNGSGTEGEDEPRSPSTLTGSPELVFKVPVPIFMAKSPRSPVSPSMAPLPPCLVYRAPSNSRSPQIPPRRIQRRSSLPLPLDVVSVSHAHLHPHTHTHSHTHSHSPVLTPSSNPNKSPSKSPKLDKTDKDKDKDVTPETVPLRPCCPQCYPATENSVKDLIDGKKDEWQERWTRGAKKRRSVSLDETSMGYSVFGDVSNSNPGPSYAPSEEASGTRNTDGYADATEEAARPGSSGSSSGFAAVSLPTPGHPTHRHERAVVSSRAMSIHVDEVDKRRRLSALTEVSREGSRDNSRAGSRAGSRTASKENLLEHNRIWEMGSSNATEAESDDKSTSSSSANKPPLSPIRTQIPPHLSHKHSPSSSPTSLNSFSSASRYKSPRNVPIKPLLDEDEDEDQLFPLPSPRRTPSNSPSGSPLGSVRGSPAPSPVPSPGASTSQVNLVSTSSNTNAKGRVMMNPAASASRDSLVQVISSTMEKESESILGQSLSRKDKTPVGGRCEKGLLTPESPSNIPMSTSPPSFSAIGASGGRVSPVPTIPRSPSPLRHSHSGEGYSEDDGSVEPSVESTGNDSEEKELVDAREASFQGITPTTPSIARPIPIPIPPSTSLSTNENLSTSPNPDPNPSPSPLTSFRKLFNRGHSQQTSASGSESAFEDEDPVESSQQQQQPRPGQTPKRTLSISTSNLGLSTPSTSGKSPISPSASAEVGTTRRASTRRRPSLQSAVAGVLKGVSSMGTISMGGTSSMGGVGGA
ncbi:hypothetical protein VKT23_002749 [Stygiomarasmius scandens]|uniref:Uncharacterized protein n=1 Tax=Marasmiellus scandens TaxID=2682957 RepID=A0ABR1JVW3_9AGAR